MSDIESLIAHYGLIAILVGAALEGETVAMIGGMSAHRGLFALPADFRASRKTPTGLRKPRRCK